MHININRREAQMAFTALEKANIRFNMGLDDVRGNICYQIRLRRRLLYKIRRKPFLLIGEMHAIHICARAYWIEFTRVGERSTALLLITRQHH